MSNKTKPKRNKSGKIKAFTCHLRCEFTKPDDSNTYIERCTITVPGTNLKAVKGTEEMYQATDKWIRELIAENSYKDDCKLIAERWEAVR